MAQTEIPLNDLSAFKNPSANWSIEGDASGNPNSSVITPKAGKGVLLCTLKGAKYQRTDDLRFNLEHGDIRLSLDFIIPKGSNSGIYLQGRYEVQI
ncbi:family 16 glycoside hydrolase [Pseudarcicella hirudinis]